MSEGKNIEQILEYWRDMVADNKSGKILRDREMIMVV